jgi:hypothetical protein
VADIELGVALVQAEEEAQDLGGRIGSRPGQGHQQPGPCLMAEGASAAGGMASGPTAAGEGVGLAGEAFGPRELGGQGLELGQGQAGEAGEGPGVSAEGLGGEHRGGPPHESMPSGNLAGYALQP